MPCCLLQVGTGDDLDLVLTKLAISENVAKMLPIDGSSIGICHVLSFASSNLSVRSLIPTS